MSVKISESVPRQKMDQFHGILKACGGRYLHNPIEIGDVFCVSYEYEDVRNSNEHGKRWRRATEDVREVRKDQWWRKLARRFRLGFILKPKAVWVLLWT